LLADDCIAVRVVATRPLCALVVVVVLRIHHAPHCPTQSQTPPMYPCTHAPTRMPVIDELICAVMIQTLRYRPDRIDDIATKSEHTSTHEKV
jgi:hypothetical protein